MNKSSRFWWLHGAILVAAVVGCKSNSCGTNGSCGGMGQGAPPAANTSGPIGSASSMMYHQGASGNYPGMSNMMSGPSGMPGAPGGAGGVPGQTFMPQGAGAYSGPSASSGLGAH